MKDVEKPTELSCEDITAMLSNGEIDLVSLDTSVLKRLMNYEIDLTCKGNADRELLFECANLLYEREKDLMRHEDFMCAVDKSAKKYARREVKRSVADGRPVLKRAILIAVVISLLLAGFVLVSGASSLDVHGCIALLASILK